MEALPELEEGLVAPLDRDPSQPLLQKDRLTNATTGISHMAIVGADGSLIESLDYEVLESDLFKQDWRARTQCEVLQYVILKWTFAFLVGLFTGLVGIIINVAVENIAGAKLMYTAKLIYSNQLVLAFSLVTGCNVVLVLCSALLCVYLGPAAAGSGIPEVKAYLNGVDAPEILSPKTLFVKVLGSIGSVAGGLYVGKEGPLVHIGACIASLLGQGGSRKHHLTFSWLRLFKNDRDRRDLVTCGAAAGVAAAFRAPVGGVLFALEEAASWWRSSLLWRTFFTTAVVAVVLRLGSNWCRVGHCGLFGKGGLIMFDVSKGSSTYGFPELFAVMILGLSGGILGSLFNALNTRICIFYAKNFNLKGPAAKIFLACFVAVVTSVCCFGLPWLAPCRPCPQLTLPYECPTYDRSGNFKSFHCPTGQYNDLAGLVFTTNDDAIRNLFSTGTQKEYHYTSIIIFFVASYIMALLTYGIAVPSGLFIPVILCGATYGRLIGMLSTTMYDLKGLDEGVYAVLGAAAFLGGSMRMTVSLCVILLELTNNLSMLPLIMLVLLASKTVGDSFNMAIYNLHLKIKGFPILEAHPEPFMHQLTARDAVKSPLVKFSPVERVGNVMHILRTTKHSAFPVIEEPLSPKATFAGLVLRSHLLILLKKKDFYFTRSSSTMSCRKISSGEFAKPGSGKGLTIEDIEVTPEEEDMYVILHPIINASPYTVLDTMSLAKAYTLFRQLGLRHICVMPRKPEGEPILGILTRHDFMHDHLLSIHPHLRSSLLKDRSFLRQASSDRHP
ncbi:hypothetical protein O6H91_17G034700 [Diphasiastrum complanatum]|uniref:Uncharacterized protein n=2 Tax=Diphasiastrum complanatum TaxID=34168 RepID=A0ACC2B5N9_DIPCM|nr:hypothetical protein O6H91_17G034700 [Diphasiastrum complanatum]KAJ7525064.1 hypothetical protein O6H91_17G034700 [Diphasiastrum complanatum]